jgi:hypothetical protein
LPAGEHLHGLHRRRRLSLTSARCTGWWGRKTHANVPAGGVRGGTAAAAEEALVLLHHVVLVNVALRDLVLLAHDAAEHAAELAGVARVAGVLGRDVRRAADVVVGRAAAAAVVLLALRGTAGPAAVSALAAGLTAAVSASLTYGLRIEERPRQWYYNITL